MEDGDCCLFALDDSPYPTSALYIETNLATYEPANLEPLLPREIELNGKIVFRHLDASYYAWLRRQMAVAQKAVAAQILSNSPFEDLRTKFNKVHEWAMLHIGEAALKIGRKSLNPRTLWEIADDQ